MTFAEFDEFVALRLGSLLRFAMVITCDRHVAEDVVQDVLVRAYGRWHRLTVMEHPEAYLKRMIVNEYLSWRRRSRRLLPLDAAVLVPMLTPTPDHAGHCGEHAALIGRVAALPPRQRTVIALRFFDDRSDAEIADLLNCSESTVRSTASRALAALRVTLAEKENLA
jgi:RNA polymerase sigma-70 factor (sigma-E family)